MSNTYQPCPFCHSKGVVLKQNGKNFQISCVGCGALGPVGQEQVVAEYHWNQRPETNEYKDIAVWLASVHGANVSDYTAKSVSKHKKERQISILKKCVALLRGIVVPSSYNMIDADKNLAAAAQRCEEGIKYLEESLK